MAKDKQLRSLYWIIFIIIGITFFVYYLTFKKYSILEDNSVWGTFGDYFGGILNPVIGIANIIVFVNLTRTIADLDNNNNLRSIKAEERNNERAIETQQLLFKLELKHSAYNEIAAILSKLPDTLMYSDPKKAYENITIYINLFVNTIDNNNFLFPILADKNNTSAIFWLLSDISKSIEAAIKETNEDKRNTLLRKAQAFDYDSFLKEKGILLKRLQEELIK